jgi:ABC-type multidrug transport system permease subunit
MDLILILVLIAVLGGSWYGHTSRGLTLESPVGIILLILVVCLALGLLVPHTGWHRY